MSFSVNFDPEQGQSFAIQAQLQPLQFNTARFGWSLMPAFHGHPFADAWWRLYLNLDAGMCIHGPGATVALPAQQLAILPAWVTWELSCSRSVRHIFIEITCPQFSSQQVQSLFDQALICNKSDSQILRQLMPRIQQNPHATDFGNQLMAGIHQCMASLAPTLKSILPQHQLLDALCNYINAHLADDLRIPQLAQRFSCSPKHITNLCNQYLQQSPAAYIRDQRLGRACQLLRDTDYSIEQIAALSGFANRAYLSRIMSKHMHVAPATYRKRTQ